MSLLKFLDREMQISLDGSIPTAGLPREPPADGPLLDCLRPDELNFQFLGLRNSGSNGFKPFL
jgi:hypothetical protein